MWQLLVTASRAVAVTKRPLCVCPLRVPFLVSYGPGSPFVAVA